MTPLAFAGMSIEDKRNLLQAAQEAVLTGQVAQIQTARGNTTTFDPKTIPHPEALLESLAASIVSDAEFDATNTIDAACLANRRPGITIPRFL